MLRAVFPALLTLPITLAMTLVVTLATPQPVAANPIADIICEPTERMTRKLAAQFRSEKQSMGLRGPEQVVEVWADDRGDWTMVISYSNGQSCIVAMGEAWTDMAAKDPGKDPA